MLAADGFDADGNLTLEQIHDDYPTPYLYVPIACPPRTMISMNARLRAVLLYKSWRNPSPFRKESYLFTASERCRA
jgi:hypothetical protein